jgi:hypothetical protein
MTDIKSIIATIEALLAQGTPQAITYAALECRLAIEKVCYDRLKIAHDYISHHDLRRWQPQHVVQTLIAEVTVGCIIYAEPERCAEPSIISPNVRCWGEADMPRPPAGFRSVAFDPFAT